VVLSHLNVKNMMSTTMPSMTGSEKKSWKKKIGPGWIRTGART
jgi:hypothetical protein